MSKLPMIMLGLATAVLVPTMLNSCTLSGIVSEEDINKLPDPTRRELKQIMAQEKIMIDRFSAGSGKLQQATALIAEGCGLEKEAQQLRANAAAIQQTSSKEDKSKLVVKGDNLMAAVSKKIGSASGATLKSKEKFQQGHNQKKQAEDYIDQVKIESLAPLAMRAVQVAQRGKDSLKDPMQVLAINYACVPVVTFAKDVKKQDANRAEFEEQCQQIGKKYNIKISAPRKAKPLSVPLGLI